MEPEKLTGLVLNAAFKVHTALGPGLLESVYQACLKEELTSQKVKVLSEVALPVVYGNTTIDVGYRLDLLVEDDLILEIKAVGELTALHKSQLLTYLKLSKKPLGLLLNFNSIHLKEGISRVVYSGARGARGSRKEVSG